MDLETATPGPPSKLNLVFCNDRGLRSGWRILIFLAILLALFTVVSVSVGLLVSQGHPRVDPSGPPLPLRMGLGEFVLFLLVALAAWIMGKIERRKAGVYGLPLDRSAVSRFVVGYLVWGFLPLTLVLLIMRGLGVFYFGTINVRGWEALYWAAAWGLVFLAVGLFEEYLSRGYMLYTLADGIGFWPAALIMAVLFARAHMGNSGETHIGIIATFLFAIFAAATLWRTGNLWLAIGAHAGWDWGQSFFFGVPDSGIQIPGHLFDPRIQRPDWLNGGSVGPEGSIVVLIFWALMTIAFLIFYKSKPQAAFPVRSGVPDDNVAGSPPS
jgi:membrane protease YdiL (CAAX protease family)